mmetsp:Transcript_6262/g.18977  ORF Transcript_6262/g.18977 Transcript_6262/m.18977 type:complete len:243 (+) Transcript_6262:304-1032(+)
MTGKHDLPGGVGVFSKTLVDIDGSYRSTVAGCAEGTIWSPACVPPASLDHKALEQVTRYMLIVRDPRAVTVSGYHYFDVQKDLDEYCVDKVPKVAGLTSLRYYWFDYLLRETEPTLILFYEDILEDPLNSIVRIASFLRLSPTINELASVIERTSSESMKAQEADGKLPGPNRSGSRAKVRSATTDGFRSEMSKAALRTSTRGMFPHLHPALLARYLYNNVEDLDIIRDFVTNSTFERVFLP